MAFPTTPSNGDIHTVGTNSWTYNSTSDSWTSANSANSGGDASYSNTDVDTHLQTSTASASEVLSWDGAGYDWVAQSGGGTSSYAIGAIFASGVSDLDEASLPALPTGATSGKCFWQGTIHDPGTSPGYHDSEVTSYFCWVES